MAWEGATWSKMKGVTWAKMLTILSDLSQGNTITADAYMVAEDTFDCALAKYGTAECVVTGKIWLHGHEYKMIVNARQGVKINPLCMLVIDCASPRSWDLLEKVLSYVVAGNNMELLCQLDEHGKSVYHYATKTGNLLLLQALSTLSHADVNIPDRVYGATPLYELAMVKGWKCVVTVEELLKNSRVDVNHATKKVGATPLFAASSLGNVYTADLLRQHPYIKVNQANFRGMTPLMVAAFRGHANIIDVLLTKTDLSTLLNEELAWRRLVHTVLLCSAMFPKLPVQIWKFVFSFFVSHTNVNCTMDGKTALWMAASNGHATCVERLLEEEDVDIKQANEMGISAYDIAQEKGHELCGELLLSAQSAKK